MTTDIARPPRSLRECVDGCMAFANSLHRIRAELAHHRANATNPELAAVCRRYESIVEDLVRSVALSQSSISDPLRRQIWPAGTEPLQTFF
jgi:hypothetical protein